MARHIETDGHGGCWHGAQRIASNNAKTRPVVKMGFDEYEKLEEYNLSVPTGRKPSPWRVMTPDGPYIGRWGPIFAEYNKVCISELEVQEQEALPAYLL